MNRGPGTVLVEIVAAAGDIALDTAGNRGRPVDREQYLRANRGGLLHLIARQPQVRALLAERFEPAAAQAHPLLVDLLGADGERATTAAKILAEDNTALLTPAAAAPQGSASRTGTADVPIRSTAEDRRLDRVRRDLETARQARDQARTQLQYAQQELTALKQQRDLALDDRDGALTVVQSLRAAVDVERTWRRNLRSDVELLAEMLVQAVTPVAPPTEEPDVRLLDRIPDGALADRSAPSDLAPHPAVLRALSGSGISEQAFRSVLRALANPPAPAPVGPARTRDREISLTPLGGGTEIGGSCMLVEVGDVRLLVDCGTRPRQSFATMGPADLGQAYAGHVDAVVVTHAHNDHAGYVPALLDRYPAIRIFCSADTAALLPTMWHDSVRVFERAGAEVTPPGEPGAPLPYQQAQVEAAVARICVVDHGRVVEVSNGVTIEIFPAGHILGACGVVVSAGRSRITVTGDVSNPQQGQLSVPGIAVPEAARGSDLLVIESTCCRRNGTARQREVERFLSTVADIVEGGGRVLVPAFALGRAQEVILTVRAGLPGVPVLVDGMARAISRIYEQQTADRADPLRIFGDDVTEVQPHQRRELYNTVRRGVIVSTSGMMTPGSPASTWARWILPDPRSALLVSGYQDSESSGAALLALAEQQSPTFHLGEESIEVRAHVATFALSAHADRRGLASIVTDVAAEQTMLVHGVPSAQREFSDHLRRRGFGTARTERWHG